MTGALWHSGGRQTVIDHPEGRRRVPQCARMRIIPTLGYEIDPAHLRQCADGNWHVSARFWKCVINARSTQHQCDLDAEGEWKIQGRKFQRTSMPNIGLNGRQGEIARDGVRLVDASFQRSWRVRERF